MKSSVAGLVFAMLWVGCGRQEPNEPGSVGTGEGAPNSAAPQTANLDATNVVRTFSARGLIKELPSGGTSLVVRHEEIPGFMPVMTMEFTVRDTNELRGLAAGDTIVFNVRADLEESWIDGIRRAGTEAPAPATATEPTSASLLQGHRLKPGEPLPEAELLSEDGRKIMLSDFRGSAMALTFIFTRCPLPDFCPRMNRHFSVARRLLLERSGAATNWQFLSVSFDPEFDTPEVLKRYAAVYRGSSADRWLFSVASSNVLASIAPALDFRFDGQGGGLVHNLRTVVIDARGRLHRAFDGSAWKASELVQAIEEAARIRD